VTPTAAGTKLWGQQQQKLCSDRLFLLMFKTQRIFSNYLNDQLDTAQSTDKLTLSNQFRDTPGNNGIIK